MPFEMYINYIIYKETRARNDAASVLSRQISREFNHALTSRGELINPQVTVGRHIIYLYIFNIIFVYMLNLFLTFEISVFLTHTCRFVSKVFHQPESCGLQSSSLCVGFEAPILEVS